MKKNKILVTGGAGYIGSHMVKLLTSLNYEVVVLDSLVTGSKDAVLNAELVISDLLDYQSLENCFLQHNFDAVMHFASFIQVNESIFNPAKYYRNNLFGGLNLLDAMRKFGVDKLIFSSSAAVYGEPRSMPITIDHPKKPLNAYGRAKLMFEEILQEYYRAYGLKSISLRYFNVAGADPDGQLGERHNSETHLIPLVLQVATGKRDVIEIFGNDYPTQDGTCIRDYIHVVDLCRAHVLALGLLSQSGDARAYNLGNGKGYSVLGVIDAVKLVTGKDIKITNMPRRAGDPAMLVADSELAKKELNWVPKYSSLSNIVEHAWAWENRNR